MARKTTSRIFIREAVREIAIEAARVWVWPPLAVGVTGVLGYTQGLPWMYIFLGALGAFALVSHGLLRFDEWRDRRRVDGKLAFGSVIVGRDIKGGGVIVGIRLHSSAAFPLEFEVTEVRTSLGDKIPALEHKVRKITLPAAGNGWFNDNAIELTNPPRPGAIEGAIEFRINYGLPGSSLKYSLSEKKQVVAAFNDDGLLIQGTWSDAI